MLIQWPDTSDEPLGAEHRHGDGSKTTLALCCFARISVRKVAKKLLN